MSGVQDNKSVTFIILNSLHVFPDLFVFPYMEYTASYLEK